nr:F-box/FBD/LRR-repeat protein At1g13570-like [Malus domestica]
MTHSRTKLKKFGKLSESSLKRNMELDRISNLPSDVSEQILSFLPIKEAVKTSVLSSRWRYKTATLPHLVFDNQCFPTKPFTTFEHIVDQLLVLHVGPIHTFRLVHEVPTATGHIVRWILHLSRNAIKEFILDVWRKNPYKMPSCFYSCQDLVRLTLYNCLLKPPSTFKGFRSLKNLYIREVTIAQDVLQALIDCSSLLERLALRTCSGISHHKINAPNVQFFDFAGSFENLNLENMLNLVEIFIDLDCVIPLDWFLIVLAIWSSFLFTCHLFEGSQFRVTFYR